MTKPTNYRNNEDFVWRFRIDESQEEPVHDDALLELIRVQWEELLKMCVPYSNGEKVNIDSFAVMRDLNTRHIIYRDEAIQDLSR